MRAYAGVLSLKTEEESEQGNIRREKPFSVQPSFNIQTVASARTMHGDHQLRASHNENAFLVALDVSVSVHNSNVITSFNDDECKS